MKYLFWLLYSFYSFSSWAQPGSNSLTPQCSYVLLDDSLLGIHHVVAQKADTNRANKYVSLEIFNILSPLPSKTSTKSRLPVSPRAPHSAGAVASVDTLLVAMSVLPTVEGDIEWTRVQVDTIPAQQLMTVTRLLGKSRQQLAAYTQAKKPLNRDLLGSGDLIPLIRRGTAYYRPLTYVLTETYLIKTGTVHSIKQADMATIDIKSPLISTADIRKLDAQPRSNTAVQDWSVWEALYAGNLLRSRRHGRYEFWSNATYMSHSSTEHYGAGNFIYQPGIGLVSGKYKGYFADIGGIHQYRKGFFEVISIDGKPSKFK